MNTAPPHRSASSRSVQTTSPVSVITYHHHHGDHSEQQQLQQPRVMRRSALRQNGRPPSGSRKAKSVQWVSDIKKRPQDISSNRKIVKSQVLMNIFFHLYLTRYWFLTWLFILLFAHVKVILKFKHD